jgi:hypothetical protein
VPPPQEAQPDAPREASQEEEPFEIDLVVPEGPMAQGSSAEEQEQLKDQDVEDEANEQCPSPSDTEDEKMYQDADEVESFRAEAPVLVGRLCAMLEHLGITTPQVQNQGSPTSRAGGVQSRHRDLWIQSPLQTQGTSFHDLSQRRCC